MRVPLGYHVFVRPSERGNKRKMLYLKKNKAFEQNLNINFNTEALLSKPYTAVAESLTSQSNLELSGKQICLMIKTYKDGSLTPILDRLELGSCVEISNYVGSFQSNSLEKCNELILICAGSGFTPMVKLVKEGLQIANIS